METPKKSHCNMQSLNVRNIGTPLKIPPSPLMKSLGWGTGAIVYKMERSPKLGSLRSPWAVKKISQKGRNYEVTDFNARIEREAKILRTLDHPNIVGFRDLEKSKTGEVALAMECCTTSLGTILEDRRDKEEGPLPAKHIIKMSFDIAKALDYLHNTAKLLHGDIKSFNVLVKGEFEMCKLCDFGVSLPLDENGVIDFEANPDLNYIGTNLWSAPEVIQGAELIDDKADIFSFGLLIYETIVLCPPHTFGIDDNDDVINDRDKDENLSEISLTESDISAEASALDNVCGTRPRLPEDFEMSGAYDSVIELFYCCTNAEPHDRPNARDIWIAMIKNGIYKLEEKNVKT